MNSILILDEKMLNDFVEVKLLKNEKIIIETLRRMGIGNKKTKKVTQSCHLFKFKEKYYILHFKEYYVLIGKKNTIKEIDIARRNAIILLLQNWGLIKLDKINQEKIKTPAPLKSIFVLPYKKMIEEKWELNKKI